MLDDERMDAVLRAAMQATPVPALRSSFEQDLARRLRPGQISSRGRVGLWLYGVLASLGSILALLTAAFSAMAIVGASLTPVLVAGVVLRRHVRAAIRAKRP